MIKEEDLLRKTNRLCEYRT